MPQLVQRVMRDELNIDKFITHEYQGIENVMKLIDDLHSGDCLRAVVQMFDMKLGQSFPQFTQISNSKVYGGYLKTIKH